MKERRDLIETALRKLSILPEREHRIGFFADSLDAAFDPMPQVVPSVSHGPLTPHEEQRLAVHPDDAARELKAIADTLHHLLVALQELSPTAEEKLDQCVLETDVARNLRRIMALSEVSEPDIRHAAVMAAKTALDFPKKKRGRRRDFASFELAEAAGLAFHTLTGEMPTVITPQQGPAEGPFLELVAAVFSAGGIKASPETFARQAAESLPLKIEENDFDRFRRPTSPKF